MNRPHGASNHHGMKLDRTPRKKIGPRTCQSGGRRSVAHALGWVLLCASPRASYLPITETRHHRKSVALNPKEFSNFSFLFQSVYFQQVTETHDSCAESHARSRTRRSLPTSHPNHQCSLSVLDRDVEHADGDIRLSRCTAPDKRLIVTFPSTDSSNPTNCTAIHVRPCSS